jgi:hypothetical protein
MQVPMAPWVISISTNASFFPQVLRPKPSFFFRPLPCGYLSLRATCRAEIPSESDDDFDPDFPTDTNLPPLKLTRASQAKNRWHEISCRNEYDPICWSGCLVVGIGREDASRSSNLIQGWAGNGHPALTNSPGVRTD